MKMAKIESARIIVEQKGNCIGILCADCFTTREKCGCKELGRLSWDKRKLQLATAYIKRHEQKCKKRLIPKYTADVQPDKTGSELKKIVMKATVKQNLNAPIQCCKCVRVETCKRKEKELSILPSCDGYVSNESMMYVHTVDPNEKKVESVMTTTSDPTPLDIAKMIRDNGYRCVGLTEVECKDCPLCDYNCGSGIKTNVNLRSKQLIDDYISSHEKPESRPNFRKYLRDKVDMKVKVTPELSIELQKISNEENVMFWFENRTALIRDIDHKFIIFSTNGKGLFCRICRHEKDLDPEFKKFKEYNPATDSLVEPVENTEKPEPEPVCEHLVGDLCGNAFETCDRECPANTEVPQPIRFDVPDTVYAVSEDYIRIVRTKNRKTEADSEGYMITATINGMARCYRTPEEALSVALKRWNNK